MTLRRAIKEETIAINRDLVYNQACSLSSYCINIRYSVLSTTQYCPSCGINIRFSVLSTTQSCPSCGINIRFSVLSTYKYQRLLFHGQGPICTSKSALLFVFNSIKLLHYSVSALQSAQQIKSAKTQKNGTDNLIKA